MGKQLKLGKITYDEDGNPVMHSPLGDDLKYTLYPGKLDIISMLEETAKKYGNPKRALFGLRKVIKQHITKDLLTNKKIITYEHSAMETITHKEYIEMAQNLAKGFDKILKGADKVGICLETSLEWILSAHGAHYNSLSVVSMYVNLGVEGIISIINETELNTVVCPGSMISYFEDILPKCPSLKTLVVVGTPEKSSLTLKCIRIADVIKEGMKIKDFEFKKPNGDTRAFIVYTSGTTGRPKGVQLCHKNMAYGTGGMCIHFEITEKDRHLSYLPCAHIFELLYIHGTMFSGCFVGFGSPRTLLAKEGGALKMGDLEAVKPTIFIAVPRVYSTIQKGIQQKIKIAGGLTAKLFNSVMNKRLKNLKNGVNKDVMLQSIVFKKIVQLFGGNLRMAISGGAPLCSSLQLWLQAVFGSKIKVIVGYGLTETHSAGAIQYLGNPWKCRLAPSTGFPVTCAKIKLISVPEMGYDAKKMEGEVMIHSTVNTQGYYKREDLNKDLYLIDKDGKKWLHTGDIGRFNKEGTITLIDRKKSIQKLSHGEYIALSELETLYETSSFIQPNGILVYADGKRDYPVCVALIQKSFAKIYAKENGFDTEKLEAMIQTEKFKKDLLHSFDQIATNMNKSKIERIKNVYCEFGEWTPENGLCTASSKIKRKALSKHYEEEIEFLYDPTKKITKKQPLETKEVEIEIEEEKLPAFLSLLQ